MSLLAAALPAAETVAFASRSRLASGSMVERVLRALNLLLVESGIGAFPFGRFLEPLGCPLGRGEETDWGVDVLGMAPSCSARAALSCCWRERTW